MATTGSEGRTFAIEYPCKCKMWFEKKWLRGIKITVHNLCIEHFEERKRFFETPPS
jgi:hypothetical protein